MAAAAQTSDPGATPHVPVLLRPLLAAVSPVQGVWLDGTFGAGGYTRGLLEAGAQRVIAVDRDPLAFEMAADWAGTYGDRLVLQSGNFAEMDRYGQDLDGVVLDLGVSSMQLDLAERGFSFLRDGPLDMRMSQDGPTAAEIVNTADETTLADILYLYGEERASRRIARAIVRARASAPFLSTLQLADVISGCLPPARPGQSHPATRSFQALRIAVNDEYEALYRGLMAAERALRSGGWLAVVSFHSIEDRMVKRFLQQRSGSGGRANRYAPETQQLRPRFELISRKSVAADDAELAENPRARSARLRIGVRTSAPAGDVSAREIGMPEISKGAR